MPGNPYNGHTLEEAIEQVSILAERTPKTVSVDRGYQGAELEGIRILRSGQKRGISRTLHAMIKRRSAIEPTIGHMKTDGRLGRNPLKGALGDALHVVLCDAGHNIRLLLKKLRLLFAFVIWAISGGRTMNRDAHQLAVG
jgi:IS5 family transposase